jgi:cell fate regulator YaaT (PSP1 superfamily)
MESCKRFVKEMGLPMKIVDAEHVFGGERIIFYFMSDGRVDFRELVKRIAQEYQTRIEMRQIGSRDEAKLLGDVESCGQQCCCQRFLKHLKPVNMRMAKMQKATLDPAKISGYCGRLKCCLRYEDKTYTELKKQLPKKNSRVKTQQGVGKVVDTQILTQLVMVEYEGGDRSAVGLEDIEILPPAASKQGKQDDAPKKKNQNNDQ